MLSSFFLVAQTQFENYQPLRSVGPMPDDFKLAVKAKIEQDDANLGNVNKKQQTEFLEQIHYGVDQLLNSGAVTYGNEVCKYIESVADKLLADDANLRSKLRFYVLKSNVANAFATNQGMIFFTTGLIAQFASEAQLAYVLSHEIIHFKNNHVIQSFEFKVNNKRTISQLSQYSKEHEFEADREAIKLCHKAGYAKEELLGTLDVLLFSHLPFDEYKFDPSYFNTDNFFVPQSEYPDKVFKINMDENYDDSLSTHPNIEKRRTEMEKALANYANWGENLYLLGEARFKEVRNICRFETVRNRIIYGEIPYALYELYILEKEFPNNEFLQGLKAHAWYDLARYRVDASWKALFPSQKELEGASGQFFYFLMNHKSEQTNTFALRNVYDIYEKYSENKYIQNIYQKMIRLLANQNKFKISNFYDINYKTAEEKALQNKANPPAQESGEDKATEKTDENKYSRIRRSGTKTAEGATITSVDTVNYHLYGISDILQNESFKSLYAELAKKNEEPAVYTKKQSKRKLKNELPKDFQVTTSLAKGEKLILTRPLIYTNTTSNSEKRNVEIKPLIESSIEYALNTTNTNHVKIGGRSGEEKYTTEELNMNMFVHDLLIQIGDLDSDSAPIVPIDFEQSQQMIKDLGSKKIAYFFYGENTKSRISYGRIFGFVWSPALLVMNIIEETTARYRSVAAVFTFDLETGMHNAAAAIKITSKPTKHVLRSSMYNLIQIN